MTAAVARSGATDERVAPESNGARVVTDAAAGSRITWPLRYVVACLLLAAFCFNTDSGQIVPDTKLDLVIDPGRFLARALHMWDGQGFSGQLQNQAYGYLFPIGPFFALGKWAHLEPWAIQRLWWTALLCVGFVGLSTLASALGIGNPASRMLGGLAYALSPHVLTVLGPVSAEALPMCVLPWVLIPLVRSADGASVRRGAVLSGAAVLFMGGANAALDLAAIIPVLLWFLTRRPAWRTARLFGWWVLACAAASLWWVAPLLLLGRYSPPFLQYIESAATTTSTTSTVQALRGTADWVAYVPGSGWRAGQILLSNPAVILNSVIVVAVGLAGLALRDLAERQWLVLCLSVGVVMLGFGHIAPVDGFAAGDLRSVLDGSLAPLRNVHKFDVVLRLPLVLAMCHLVAKVQWGRRAVDIRLSRVVVGAVTAVVVLGTATPLISLQAAPTGSFAVLPGYWSDAANWLAAHHSGRALIVPGSHTGLYLWGRPADEPMQALARSDWEVRDGIPLVDTGQIRQLDAVEQLFDSGVGSARLAPYLAQAGISTLIVRNDLAYTAVGAPRPVLVHQTLRGSPGIIRVATFGAPLGDHDPGQDSDLQQPYPALEVYSVAGAPTSLVDAHLSSAVDLVSGGPESLLPLPAQDLPTGAPSVLVGDADRSSRSADAAAGRVVLTDGLRRREANFGLNPPNTSATLSSTDPNTLAAAARDYLPYPGTGHQSVAELLGARSVTASSSASNASAAGPPVPGYQPYGAVDSDPNTQWRSDPGAAPVGQWLQLQLDQPVAAPYLDLTMVATGAGVNRVRVTTDHDSQVQSVTEGRSVRVPLSGAPISFVRVTVLAAAAVFVRQVGIATLHIPGVSVARTIRVADDLPASRPVDAISFAAPSDARDGCVAVPSGSQCAPYLVRPGEDDAGIDRTFVLGVGAPYRWQVTAAPAPGPVLDALISRVAHPALAVSVSSSAVDDPGASAQAAADGDLGTTWIASPRQSTPTVTLRWSGRRRVASVRLIDAVGVAATLPTAVTVIDGDRQLPARVGADGTVTFAAVRTDRLTLELSNPAGLRQSYDPDLGAYVSLGIGVSEIRVPGVATSVLGPSADRPVQLPCGRGPTVTLDGRPIDTSVTTTLGRLRALDAIPATLCGIAQAVTILNRGQHRIVVAGSPTWTPTALSADRITARPAPADGAVATAVQTWSATNRRVTVSARPAGTVLRVFENANPGWIATLNGRRLTTVTLNGWEQGYVLPAGPAATVHLVYGPDRTYRAALLLGLLCVLALLGACVVTGRRSRRSSAAIEPGRGSGLLLTAGVVTAGLLAGWRGIGAFVALGFLAVLVRWLGRPGSQRTDRRPVVWAGISAALYLIPGAVLVTDRVGSKGYADSSGLLEVCVVGAVCALAWAGVASVVTVGAGSRSPAGRTTPRSRAAGSSTSR